MPVFSRISKEKLKAIVPGCISYAQVLQELGLAPRGGNYATLKRKLNEYQIDTSHFKGQGWNVGLQFKPVKPTSLEKLLVKGSSFQSFKLKKRLIKEKLKEPKCENCGLREWLGQPIALELHHKNGSSSDNRLENLQFLCPNCHALTENYRGKNIK